ncbi:MAG TPA: YbhN family protein [Streptosporangiaceae bacterium]|nr:YbhN family protein [Streptosporangiaceae bacterium]
MIVRRRRWIWIILTLAALAFAARAVIVSRGELLAGVSNLRRASWIWLAPAIAAECGAFIALARAQRRILHGGGVNVSIGVLARLAAAAQAAGSVLPAGYLFSGVVVLRVLARRGLSQLLVLWMLAIAGLLYLVTLLLVGLIGALLAPAGKNGPELRVPAAITLAALITVFAAGMAVARLREHPWTVHEIAARMPGGRLKELIGGDVLANASLGREGWGAGFLWTLLYWTCDLGCLAIAFPAIGMIPPWRGLLIAYAAGQFAVLLPLMPGGLGATVGSMSAALAAYGSTSAGHGGTSGALAAVLLYRLINYWIVLPAGAVCYLSLRHAEPQAGQPEPRSWRMGRTRLGPSPR